MIALNPILSRSQMNCMPVPREYLDRSPRLIADRRVTVIVLRRAGVHD